MSQPMSRSPMLELTVLTVPDCPNAPVLEERLAQALPALSGRLDVRITRQVVATGTEAARLGMHGSPTLLINGVDPFAAPTTSASVSCRLYRDASGSVGGAPTVVALGEALRRAVEDPVPAALAQAAGRAGLGRLAPVEDGLRAVHQRVLRTLAEAGQPPPMVDLDQVAAPFGTTGAQVLAQLHAADFLRLDTSGHISAAYPFSPAPTPHLARVEGGPQVHAMCAIDALGIAAMLGKDVTIRSTEPGTGASITVTVPAHGDERAPRWEPATSVVFYGQLQTGTCPCPPPAGAAVSSPAADICCGMINFFTTPQAARHWAQHHPQVAGQVLTQHDAWQIGVRIFAPLLHPGP